MLSKSPQGDFEKRLFQGSPGIIWSPDANSLDWHKLSGLKPRTQSKLMYSQSASREIGVSDRARQHDKPEKSDDTGLMNEITREEFNAKLETIEVKMDARVEAVSAKIDTFLAVQAERDKRLDESLANIRGDISRLGSLKLSIWGAMFTGLAITLTVIGLGLTSYQAGQADRHPAEITQPASPPPAPAK